MVVLGEEDGDPRFVSFAPEVRDVEVGGEGEEGVDLAAGEEGLALCVQGCDAVVAGEV